MIEFKELGTYLYLGIIFDVRFSTSTTTKNY